MFVFLCFVHIAGSSAKTITLTKGEKASHSIKDIERVVVTNPDIAEVSMSRDEKRLTIIGLMEGKTNIHLFGKRRFRQNLSVVVINRITKTAIQVRSALKGIEGLRVVRRSDGYVDVYGRVRDLKTYLKSRHFLSRYPDVRPKFRLTNQILQYMTLQLRSELNARNYPGLTILQEGGGLIVKGSVKSKFQILEAEQTIYSIFPQAQVELTHELPYEDSVLIDIKFLEVKKSHGLVTGVSWPSSLTFIDESSSLVLNQNFPVNLNLLLEKGLAKILSNPKLLCKNGVPASFLAGGEIPIRLISERSTNILFKPYGINIDVTARTDFSKNVALDIFAKISDIDTSITIEGLPGFIEHHVRTSTNLKLNETVALAGLFENRHRKNISKVPILGHVPILGELFKSRSFQNNESEFLLALTPTLPIPNIQQRILKINKDTQNNLKPSIFD